MVALIHYFACFLSLHFSNFTVGSIGSWLENFSINLAMPAGLWLLFTIINYLMNLNSVYDGSYQPQPSNLSSLCLIVAY